MSREDVVKILSEHLPRINEKELWIFGAGNTAALYNNGLIRLEKENFHIAGYIDNDREKWGKMCNGKKIVSLESLRKKKDKICILICSVQSRVVKSIKSQLFDNGFNCFYHIDEVIFKLHKNQLLQVYDLFTDEESQDVYEKLINERMNCEGTLITVDMNDEYFALRPFMTSSPNEVFIDCGSYVGDTIEKYIWKKGCVFKKIVGFEPEENNFIAMQHRINRLKQEWGLKESAIEIFQKGIADKCSNGIIKRYDINNGLSSKFVSVGNEQGNNIVTLDSFFKEPYSFLKADVESWEYKLLQGATKGIKTNKPLLAICIYHNAVDFYEIPLLIHDLVPEYQLAVRHHSYTLADTVLYAWVPDNEKH